MLAISYKINFALLVIKLVENEKVISSVKTNLNMKKYCLTRRVKVEKIYF